MELQQPVNHINFAADLLFNECQIPRIISAYIEKMKKISIFASAYSLQSPG